MFHIISLQTARNITEIRNTSQSTSKKKSINALIFSWYKIWVFSLFLSTFFLDLGQTTNQNSFFSYHILTNILSINYNCFVIKKSPNKIPFRKLSLNWKEHSKKNKKRTCFKKHVLLIRFIQISVLQGYSRTMLH